MRNSLLASITLTIVALGACGDGDPKPEPGAEVDAGTDASAETDASSDSSEDVASDAASDAGNDAATSVTKFKSAYAGGSTTCAVRTSDDVLTCWGTAILEKRPSAGPGAAFTELTVSDETSCAVLAGGAVSCWGIAKRAGTGATDGGGNTVIPPTTPTGLSAGVKSVSVGLYVTCSVMNDGSVKCWGDPFNSVLGGGVYIYAPTTRAGLSDIASMAIGGGHACAVATNGEVKCWGNNIDSQLGDDTNTSREDPQPVLGITDAKSVVVGEKHSCALTTAGAVKCWGKGPMSGMTGSNVKTATTVAALTTGVTSVVAGDRHTCALLQSGKVQCWGDNGDHVLGDGTGVSSATPVDVMGVNDAIAIVSGAVHACALRASGTMTCWGLDAAAQLGQGHTWTNTPVDVPLPAPVTSISGGWFNVGVIAGSEAIGWGSNNGGAIVLGGSENRTGPAKMAALAGSAEVSIGYLDACARSAAGGVTCWGNNFFGEVGSGSVGVVRAPEQVVGITSGATSVTVGNNYVCALISGGVKCWGTNTSGELGDGSKTTRTAPVDMNGATSGIATVLAASYTTCVVTTGGALKCTGNTPGDGSDQATSLVDVTGLGNNVTAVGAGISVHCASTANTLRCWGAGGKGELGDGTNTPLAKSPVTVTGMTNAISIAGGLNHMCAVTGAGGVKCWGDNQYGQLGDGTFTNRNAPVDVVGLGSGVTKVVAGTQSTCALTSAGAVKCWGFNGLCAVGAFCDGLAPQDVP